MTRPEILGNMANILRRDVLKMTTKAGSGHPTSCLSCADILAVLFFQEMNFDSGNPFNMDNDEFVLSKGHAAPLLYAVLARAGAMKEDIMTLRKFGSPYEGHPIPSACPWAKVATGSLGQGLSNAAGMALAAKLQKRTYRTYALLGDSECAEGSVYEALELASHYKLSNLCVIVDINRLGQSTETMLGHNIEPYKKRFEAFDFNVIEVDGHDIDALIKAFKAAKRETKKPTAILAKTIKGKGVKFLEDKEGWHGKTLSDSELDKALKAIPSSKVSKIKINKPRKANHKPRKLKVPLKVNYKTAENIATREAFGNALVGLSKSNNMVLSIDAETKNSTFAEKIEKKDSKKFIQAFIAEQNMIGMAQGLAVKGYDVFASTFGAFLTRTHDQLRMAALSSSNMTIVGSHAGISIGEDGPSQMALEDISMFRSLPGSIVLYPSDAVACEKLMELAMWTKGLKYIRTSRPKTPVIYRNGEKFALGEFKILKNSNSDKLVIVGAGVTLHEALKAHEALKKKGINSAVIDCYCIKPFNEDKFNDLVARSGNRVIVAEDHYPEGGIGEMIKGIVKEKIEVEHLAIMGVPHSGAKEVLMKNFKIDSDAIVEASERLLK